MAAPANGGDGSPGREARDDGSGETSNDRVRKRNLTPFWDGLACAVAFVALGGIAALLYVGGAIGSGGIVYSVAGLVVAAAAVVFLVRVLVHARRRRDDRFVAGLLTGFGIFLLLIGLCVAQ